MLTEKSACDGAPSHPLAPTTGRCPALDRDWAAAPRNAIAVYSLVGLAPTMIARMPTLSFAPVKAMVTPLAAR